MEVFEYEIKYPHLDIKHLISNKKLFDYDLIAAHVKEYHKGFKVKNIGKTHRTGTKLIYGLISDKRELEKYKEKVIEMINVHNYKYETQITLEEFND